MQPNQAAGAIVNAGVNFDSPSATIIVSLETNNYSVIVNMSGYLESFYSGTGFYTSFTITKVTITYFTVSIDDYPSDIDSQIEKRLTIHESGDYNFNFVINDPYSGDYVNYEVILAEVDLIIQPKTDIISEAPYVITFILLGVISYAFISRKKKRD